MSVRFQLVDAAGLAPYAGDLRRLEASIEYPIGDGADQFTIDHGERYPAFFDALGETNFLIAVDRGELVGILIGVGRAAIANGRRIDTIYGADFKLARRVRGTGLARKMLWRAFGISLSPRFLLRWRLAYVAAMRGARGDFMRSARGVHAAKLASPAATLAIYFVPPRVLAGLDVAHAPPPPTPTGLDLSPDAASRSPGVTSTAGRKDLRLRSTGQPWPLVHLPLGPRSWLPTWGAYLRRAGEALVREGAAGPVCFGIDERISDHTAWLAAQGVSRGAVCNVYSFRKPGAPRPGPWVHLATSEI
jgi:hypothetical protein